MRYQSIAVVILMACGLAFAQTNYPPGNSPPTHPVLVPPAGDDWGGGDVVPASLDTDLDGFAAALDCNDGDPAIKPNAIEIANGFDDNCDGVVDDGFDTTIDWPQVDLAAGLWPLNGSRAAEVISTETEPRLVWTGNHFMAVWIDAGRRLRVARIGLDATLLDPPAYLRKPVRSMDAAWTGTRLGIVYEDVFGDKPSVRLMLVDSNGFARADVLIAEHGSEPKIAWGQDRFGIVWRDNPGAEALRFQRFDLSGQPLSPAEPLGNSGAHPAITFSGTTVVHQEGERYTVVEGLFGVAYEAYFAFGTGADVLLTAFPREPERMDPIGPVRVNAHMDRYAAPGTVPTIAANVSGFAVGWHTVENDLDRAQARFFSVGTLTPVQEFTPDQDPGRYGRMAWTGGEFVMTNDNITGKAGQGFDVHVRRCDASANTHVDAGWGPWSELNLRSTVPGTVSVHPDIVNAGSALGVLWVERDPNFKNNGGRIWIAILGHK